VAGLVITRQRPKTAKGTFFITLEDEGGFANIIVPKKCYEQQRRLLRRVRFLGCRGRLQLRDGVVNLLANSFEDLEPAELLASPTRGQHLPVWGSRDFR
jgi:error-prone DNA polymerase